MSKGFLSKGRRLGEEDSIPPVRETLEISHRLIYYRNGVYEFGQEGVKTHDVADWEAAIRCPITWHLTPAGNSARSVESLKDYANSYNTIKYHLLTANCHIFANRVAAFLFSSPWPQ